MMTIAASTKLGRYEIRAKIGAGGSGAPITVVLNWTSQF